MNMYKTEEKLQKVYLC